MSLPAAQYCKDNGIILYCLLPNVTHILLACDIGLLSPMKTKWKEMVKNWQMHHTGEPFTKQHFPEVFQETGNSVATLSNSVSDFKRSDLYPLTHEGIDKTKLGPSKLDATVAMDITPPSLQYPSVSSSGHQSCSALIANETPATDVSMANGPYDVTLPFLTSHLAR